LCHHRRVKKTLLLLLAAAGILTGSAAAQNLLVNGDFETGSIAPWVGGTIVPNPDGGFSGSTVAALSQTVATTAGKQYLVAADMALNSGVVFSATLTAAPAGGGIPDGTRSFTTTTPVPAPIRASLFFTASSASTTIFFSVPIVPGPIGSLTVDNAVMVEAEPSNLVGTYAGTNAVTLKLATPELSNKAARKVTARITADNQIHILDGAQAILTGVILNDGMFEVNAGFGTLQGAGTAKIQGKRIQLEFNAQPVIAFDSKGVLVPNTVSNKIVLTKKK
jgi:hypothetical protein